MRTLREWLNKPIHITLSHKVIIFHYFKEYFTTTLPQHYHTTTTTTLPQHYHSTKTKLPQHHHNTTTTLTQHCHHHERDDDDRLLHELHQWNLHGGLSGIIPGRKTTLSMNCTCGNSTGFCTLWTKRASRSTTPGRETTLS